MYNAVHSLAMLKDLEDQDLFLGELQPRLTAELKVLAKERVEAPLYYFRLKHLFLLRCEVKGHHCVQVFGLALGGEVVDLLEVYCQHVALYVIVQAVLDGGIRWHDTGTHRAGL